MIGETSVTCPGVVFSSLLTDQLCLADVQEGFLLGSSTNHTSTHITDADINGETTRKVIYISSYHTLEYLGCLYNCGYKVSSDTVDAAQNAARDSNQEVIGWFTSRSCIDAWDIVSLRERIVHHQLQSKFNTSNFLFLIINWKKESANAFPTSNCVLYNTTNNKQFSRLPLQVSNLGNTSNTDYQLDPSNPSLYQSQSLSSITSSLKCTEPGVEEIMKLHTQLEASLKKQLKELSQVQLARNDKIEQLLTLRSLCYHSSIIPDTEISYTLEKEKAEVHSEQPENKVVNGQSKFKPVETAPGNKLADINAKKKVSRKSTSPALQKKETPKKDLVGDIDKDLRRMTVRNSPKPKTLKPSPRSSSVTSNESPRSKDRSMSPGANRLPVGSAKRRLNSQSPKPKMQTQWK